jgi:hypothetical protein
VLEALRGLAVGIPARDRAAADEPSARVRAGGPDVARREQLRPPLLHHPRPADNEWNVGGFADAFSLHDCLRPHIVGVWWHLVHPTGMVDLRRDLRGRHADGFAHCGGIARERP